MVASKCQRDRYGWDHSLKRLREVETAAETAVVTDQGRCFSGRKGRQRTVGEPQPFAKRRRKLRYVGWAGAGASV